MRAIIIILLLTPLFNHAQHDSTFHRHKVGIEAFGKAIAFGGFFYEYNFKNRLGVGASIGLAEYSKSPTKPTSYALYSSSIYGNYHFNLRKKNIKPSKKTILQVGLTFLHATGFKLDPFQVDGTATETIGFIGFGYEYSPKKSFFRIEPYLLIWDDLYDSNDLWPWLGLSFGRKF